MSDEIKNEANEAAQPEEAVVLQIIMTKDGQVKVVGMLLADRTACYGLLETAKDLVRELHTPKVIRPTGGMMNFARNGKH